jgi:ATP-dependent helicase/nuclease subunit A
MNKSSTTPPITQAQREQQRASSPKQSVWVSASAGTGKTKVLTDRVLSLLLTGVPPHKILCLTFTRAAAAEMANRINQSLSRWAVADDLALLDDLADLNYPVSKHQMVLKARRLFRAVLETPGGMKIQTIHSFCESLLSRFPLEAGLPPYFSVLDETEVREGYLEARMQVFTKAAVGKNRLSIALLQLAAYAGEDRFSELMEILSNYRSRFERVFSRFGGGDGAASEAYKRMGVSEKDTEAGLISEACSSSDLELEGLRLSAKELNVSPSQTDRRRGMEILGWLEKGNEDRITDFDSYKGIFLTAKDTIRISICSKKFGDKYPEYRQVISDEASRIYQIIGKLNSLKTAQATAAMLVVGEAMNQAYTTWKQKKGRLDYNDLVLHARRLLESDRGASWALFKLDGGIDHILIDEAQDTNPDQWAVIGPLVEEFFSGSGARNLNRTVFAVGDPKQSIYSFQQADPAAFESMRVFWREKVRGAGRQWDDVSLDVSFRSAEPILELVDKVFSNPSASDGVVQESGIRHIPYRIGCGGCVEVWPLAERQRDTEDPPWTLPVKMRNDPQPSVRLAKVIAAQVRQWIEDKDILESQGRPIRPSDILVLVQRRTAFVTQLVRELKAIEVPVSGVDRMKLKTQLPVQDLLALGSFLLLPEDNFTLATVLKGPLFGLDDDDLFFLTRDLRGRSLWWSLQKNRDRNIKFADTVAQLEELRALTDVVSPFELYGHVLTNCEGLKKIIGRLGYDARDPIEEFMTRALLFENGHPASLQSFVNSIFSDSGDVKRDLDEGKRDEVRIMTIHGAKGLQAPIVFLPDTLSEPRIRTNILWMKDDFPLWAPFVENAVGVAAKARVASLQKQEQEYRRLLYVALTRAQDRLYVSGWETGRKSREGNWYELIRKSVKGSECVMDLSALSSAGWLGLGYRLETEHRVESGSGEYANLLMDQAAIPPGWAFEPAPAENPVATPLVPSHSEEAPATMSPFSPSGKPDFGRGLIIHELLQFLPEVDPGLRQKTAEFLLAKRMPNLNSSDLNGVISEVMKIFSDPVFSDVFSPGSRTEVPLTGRVGERNISGRIDRLCVGQKQILVVDYKSSRLPPIDSSAVPTVYLRQMAAYRVLLRKIWKNKEVHCALLWTVVPSLMFLPDECLVQFEPD